LKEKRLPFLVRAALDGKTGPAYDIRDADTVDSINNMPLT
jgi:hypothetical protein